MILDIDVEQPRALSLAASQVRHSSFTGVFIAGSERYDQDRLEDLLEDLPAPVFRAKGIVPVDDGTWTSFHVVGGRAQVQLRVPKPSHGQGRIALFGRDLSEQTARRWFAACQVQVTRALSSTIGLLALAAGCETGPHIRTDVPMKATFAAPPGLQILFQAREERWVKVDLDTGPFERTITELAKTDERYETLPRNGYLITRTLLDDSWWVNQQESSPAFSQVGLSLRFTVDRQGDFIEVTNADDYIGAIKNRAIDRSQLELLRNQLSPEVITAPLKSSWQSQLDNVCGHTLSAGDSFFRLDETSVTAAREIPIRALERETVVGSAMIGLTPVMTIRS